MQRARADVGLTTAMLVGLNYGVGRAINATVDEPRRVMFYDMGSGSLVVSIMEYYGEVVKYGYKKKKNKTVSALDVKVCD